MLAITIFMAACGNGVIFEETREVPDMTLRFDTPLVYEVPVEKAGSYLLEADIAYYADGIARDDLPLYVLVETPQSVEPEEFPVMISLRHGSDYRGEIDEETKVDRTLTETLIPKLDLKASNYVFKVFSNDTASKEVYGLLDITLRLKKN